jgi:Uma2 family endonuclease
MSAQPLSRWSWTREKYHLAGELGFFKPGERTELLEGEVVLKLSPQKTPHATAISLAQYLLDESRSAGYFVRVQLPIILDDASEPEPDLALVMGTPRDYERRHPMPQDIGLLIEVSDSSVDIDLGQKSRLYAQARIPEYWVINLVQRTLEVMTDPQGTAYSTRRTYAATAKVSANCLSTEVAVADLLPGIGTNG